MNVCGLVSMLIVQLKKWVLLNPSAARKQLDHVYLCHSRGTDIKCKVGMVIHALEFGCDNVLCCTCHFKSGSFIISKKRGMMSSLAHAYLSLDEIVYLSSQNNQGNMQNCGQFSCFSLFYSS